jgi:Domain of unknown function (DUF5060)/Cellulase (glycosyl hydrolase family 5)
MFKKSIQSILFFAAVFTPGFYLLEAQTPEIVPLAAPQLWQRAEFRVDNAPVATNCFDPDLIRLDATFTPPSGRALTVPAFWYQDFSRAMTNGTEMVSPVGSPQWRIRFTPTEPGDYTLSLSIETNGVSAGQPTVMHFSVPVTAPSGQHGYVKIGANKRYFETTDGRPLRLIGENVCWAEHQVKSDYDAWFGSMRNAGENFARLWMAPWFAGIEHMPGRLNNYDLQSAWQLDYIFDLAGQDDIYVLLCFDHHGMFQANNRNWNGSNNFWKTNAYNQVNGGPCVQPNDFFTDAKAKTLYQKRLRYLIGRYGYSPYLLAWQFFNEIDNVYGPLNGDDVTAWHREMGQWLHAHDPYGHLVTTSLTGGSERPEIWSLPEMDFSVYHSYNESAPGKHAATLARSFIKDYGKPMMIGEFGVDSRSWNIASDPYLRGFRQALWSGALGGSVGTAMPWWWQNIHKDGVYPLFEAMSEILHSAGWQSGAWIPADFISTGESPTDLARAIPNGEPFTAQLTLNSAWRMQRQLSGKLALADSLAADLASENLMTYLLGKHDAEFQHPYRITAFFGEKAKLMVHVKTVFSDAELIVRIDGTEVLHTNFIRAPGATATYRDINLDFTNNIPSGKRVIEIANDNGADWVLIDSLKFEQVLPAEFAGGWHFTPEAVGLRSVKKAVLYVYSPWVIYPAGAHTYNPPLLTGESLQLKNWPAGKFNVQWFDPCTGKVIGTTKVSADKAILTLPLPAFRDDLAAIVTPQQ